MPLIFDGTTINESFDNRLHYNGVEVKKVVFNGTVVYLQDLVPAMPTLDSCVANQDFTIKYKAIYSQSPGAEYWLQRNGVDIEQVLSSGALVNTGFYMPEGNATYRIRATNSYETIYSNTIDANTKRYLSETKTQVAPSSFTSDTLYMGLADSDGQASNGTEETSGTIFTASGMTLSQLVSNGAVNHHVYNVKVGKSEGIEMSYFDDTTVHVNSGSYTSFCHTKRVHSSGGLGIQGSFSYIDYDKNTGKFISDSTECSICYLTSQGEGELSFMFYIPNKISNYIELICKDAKSGQTDNWIKIWTYETQIHIPPLVVTPI